MLLSTYPTRAEARAYIRSVLLPRERESHKGDHGRAVLACGSAEYAGAAILAAEGALRAGAGLTYLLSVGEATAAARARLPEVICRTLPPITEEPEAYLPFFGAAGALLIGCGIGQAGGSEAFCRALSSLLASEGAPVVLDADALNLLARQGATEILKNARREVILTPHEMEFSRLSGLSLDEIKADRVGAACRFAALTGAVVLLKGAGSVVARADGGFAVCPSGSPALAKGGTGDVLAGLTVGLIAGGLDPFASVFCAAYLHGEAGEVLERQYSERGVLPSELPRTAAMLLREYLAEET